MVDVFAWGAIVVGMKRKKLTRDEKIENALMRNVQALMIDSIIDQAIRRFPKNPRLQGKYADKLAAEIFGL